MKYFRNIIYFLLDYSGLPFIIRHTFQRNKVTIILYHDIDRVRFRRHILSLRRLYHLISLQDYYKARTNPEIKLPVRSIIITFDDGHKNNYLLLPLIKELHIPVTIFLCSSIIDSRKHFWFKHGLMGIDNLRMIPDEKRISLFNEKDFDEYQEYEDRQSLNKEEIQQMSNNIDFQSHTQLHPFLPACTDSRSEREIKESRLELEQKFKMRINSISYPNGDYSEREIKFAKQAGYEFGITVDIGFNTILTDAYRLKRLCVSDEAGISEMLVQAAGVSQFIKRILKKPSYGYVKAPFNDNL